MSDWTTEAAKVLAKHKYEKAEMETLRQIVVAQHEAIGKLLDRIEEMEGDKHPLAVLTVKPSLSDAERDEILKTFRKPQSLQVTSLPVVTTKVDGITATEDGVRIKKHPVSGTCLRQEMNRQTGLWKPWIELLREPEPDDYVHSADRSTT